MSDRFMNNYGKHPSAKEPDDGLAGLLRGDLGAASDVEILELLLAPARRSKDLPTVAQRLMERFGGLPEIVRASAVELNSIPGVSDRMAGLLRVTGQVVSRCAAKEAEPPELFGDESETARFLLRRFEGLTEETLLLVFLNNQRIILGEEFIGAGTIDRVVTFPRQVMRLAFRYNASRLVIAHNHPHGPPLPSFQDGEEAERLRDILRPFDITLEDSIVVGGNRCFSIFLNRPL